MLSVLWEIIIPLLIAFAIGVLVGWLLWRWRRTRVTVTEWDEIASLADAHKSGLIDLREDRDRLGRELESVSVRMGDLSTASARVGELEREAQELRAELEASEPAVTGAASLAELGTGWHQGTTTLGTPGSDHADDLKAISGIGPAMEELLNGFGIRSWEQLAALDPAGVAKVDAALEDFRGRVERDEWVEQARAFIANGHEPLDWDKTRPAPDWARGTTELGTFGAEHVDDLKVINGVGPMMEGILNEFGITAWEQVAALNTAEIERVNDAIKAFPGRIERDRWVDQAVDLVRRFPDTHDRPTRETFLNESGDDDPKS